MKPFCKIWDKFFDNRRALMQQKKRSRFENFSRPVHTILNQRFVLVVVLFGSKTIFRMMGAKGTSTVEICVKNDNEISIGCLYILKF